MGAGVWHVERAKHNFEVYEYLLEDHPDWATVALFYSALHWVHAALADEPGVCKDERHPRKHTSIEPRQRGVHQMIAELYPSIAVSYRSLFEMSLRTRYDHEQLGEMAMPMLLRQFKEVKRFCAERRKGRVPIPTSSP